MPNWIEFIAMYGFCFGLQNKVPWLDGKNAFLDALLKCTYCTGFHCGWIVWLLSWALSGKLPVSGGVPPILASLILWTFSSSAVCYVVDTAVRWFEANTPAQE